MKYIIFSDIHLSNWQGNSNSKERISQRLLDQKSILQQLIDLAIENDAILLHGGDVFHCVGSVPTEALNVYNWFINECKKCEVKYYTAIGNHDLSVRKNFSQWHNILNLFQSTEERNKELSLLNPTVKFVDYQDEDVENIKGWDILILHKQPETTNKYGFKHEGVNWKKIAKNNRLSFYGHFHETKKLGAMAYVIGQPMQMTQSDVGEDRGCYIVDSENWSVTFHKLDYPELKKIEKVEVKEAVKIEERIKSSSFQDILVEWLDKEQKPNSYLDLIQKDITDKIQTSKTFFNGKIQSIYLKDFLSFDEIKVELKNGFWLVVGPNGAGKTSIFEGVLWVLYDSVTKNLAKQEVVRDRPTKQKEAIGVLNLVDNNQFYTIRRSSKEGLRIISDKKNLVEGMTKIQSQEFLEKNFLGFDKNTFLASCYFSQKQLTTLAQLGCADTTNMVTNFLGFETYDSLYELMNQRIKEVTIQSEELEKKLVTIDNDVWKNSEQQKNLKERIDDTNKTIVSLNDEQSKIDTQTVELNKMVSEIVIPTVTTEELDNSISLLMSSRTELFTKNKTLQETKHLKTQELRKSLNLEQTKLQTILQEQGKIDKEKEKIKIENKNREIQISKLNNELENLLKNPDKLCPTCGAKMDDEKWASELALKASDRDNLIAIKSPNEQELDKNLNSLYDQEAEVRELINNFNEQVNKQDAELTELLSANQAEIEKIEQEIINIRKKKDDILKSLTEANISKVSLTQQIKQLGQRRVAIVNQLQQVNIDEKLLQLKELENKFINLDAEKLDIEDKKHIVDTNKTIYEFWKHSFSSKGIRPLLLDKFCNEFNSVSITLINVLVCLLVETGNCTVTI